MLLEFTLANGGGSTWISGDHVEVVSTMNGVTAILLQDRTVINVTQAADTVAAAVNASILPVLVAQPGT